MRRMRKSVKRKMIAGILLAVVQLFLIVLCQCTTRYLMEEKYKGIVAEKEDRLKEAGRMVYVTCKEIKAGELFTAENTEKRYILSEQNPEALANEVIGHTACADLYEGEIITKSLCCEMKFSSSERRCVFYDIKFTENFDNYAVVDVRIRYANGENYCVLKKKSLQKAEEDTGISFFSLTEEEQLLMSAARYDVEVYDGAELYLVGFMEERLQGDAVSEYLPPIQVVSQLWNREKEGIQSYEEWCGLRRALEQRLSEYRKQRLDGLL